LFESVGLLARLPRSVCGSAIAYDEMAVIGAAFRNKLVMPALARLRKKASARLACAGSKPKAKTGRGHPRLSFRRLQNRGWPGQARPWRWGDSWCQPSSAICDSPAASGEGAHLPCCAGCL